MAMQTMTGRAGLEEGASITFNRLAGMAGVAAGLAGLLYSIAFVVLKEPLYYSIMLMVGGLATVALMVALYLNLRHVEPGAAQLGLLVGVFAALGSVIHGGYDLSNAINPPAAANADLPSQVDPRGLLTFGLAGLALFAFSWLITRSDRLPRGLGYAGYLLAALLVVIYLARLIVLDPGNLIVLLPAAATGFIVNPLWNIWAGLSLLHESNVKRQTSGSTDMLS
jgi:hypothetical protein